MKKAPPAPQEDPSVRVLRERQVADLAELDEEENRRLKAGRKLSRGVRAFRPSAPSNSNKVASSAGSTGQAAAARAAVSQFRF